MLLLSRLAPKPAPALPPGVVLRVSPRARRMALRLDATRRVVELVVPRGASLAEAARFADRNAGWISARQLALPQPVPFAPGATIPIEGVPHVLEPSGSLRGTVSAIDGRLLVPGQAESFERRVRTHLTGLARQRLIPLVTDKAAAAGKPVAQVSLKDTRSRWGSCSPDGQIALSWRLVLAPPLVADYVAAHEAAHLVHLNHSAAFWQVCDRLALDAKSGRFWLKRHGAELWRYGAT